MSAAQTDLKDRSPDVPPGCPRDVPGRRMSHLAFQVVDVLLKGSHAELNQQSSQQPGDGRVQSGWKPPALGNVFNRLERRVWVYHPRSEYTLINPTCKPHVMSEYIFIQILCSSMPCRYVCDFMCVCVCIYVLPRYPSKWWATSGYKQNNCQPASWNRKNMGKFKVPLGNPEVVGLKKLWELNHRNCGN